MQQKCKVIAVANQKGDIAAMTKMKKSHEQFKVVTDKGCFQV